MPWAHAVKPTPAKQHVSKARLNIDFMTFPLHKMPDATQLASGWN
jgi:hypothetical protein